ncbi:hypothetical protein DFJ73DRAFT_861289 [Zopfochytrium polystomum]|nr:hypothetical protein DFJ73DRAFT_861289 [Zopfochytrium polystomum]
MGWLDEDDADLLGCISVLNRDTVLRDVELWDVEILTPEEMGCVDDCGGFLDGDDEFTLLAGCSFDPSSPADCDIWDVPVLSPAEMGWQDGDDGEVFLTGPGHVPTSEKRDHPDFLRRAFLSESSCAAANDDAEFPILTPIEMGWLGENDDTFLSGILTANADDDWRKRASSLPSPPISPPAPLRRLVKTLKTTAKKVAATNAAPKARRQQLCRRTASLPSPPASPPLRRCRPRASVCAKSGR